jgi:hypothetical protein
MKTVEKLSFDPDAQRAMQRPSLAGTGMTGTASFPGRKQRLLAGRSLHGTVPRRRHARRMRTCGRRDPIDALQASNRARL